MLLFATVHAFEEMITYKTIYSGSGFDFLLLIEKKSVTVTASEKHPSYHTDITHARIVRRPTPAGITNASGQTDNEQILMDYTWPVQLTVELSVSGYAGASGAMKTEHAASHLEANSDGRACTADAAREKGNQDLHSGAAGKIVPPQVGPDGCLRFSIHVVSHHRTGMAPGEFTEDEFYEVSHPFDDNIICQVADIIRKTRFAIAERHLEHLPNQTYPPIDDRQGPYGHPTGRKFHGIPVRKRKKG